MWYNKSVTRCSATPWVQAPRREERPMKRFSLKLLIAIIAIAAMMATPVWGGEHQISGEAFPYSEYECGECIPPSGVQITPVIWVDETKIPPIEMGGDPSSQREEAARQIGEQTGWDTPWYTW